VFERYTESARRALFFARYEVGRLGATAIGAEHLLLGLMHEPKGVLSRILAPLPSENIHSS
jgi:ATP-dependent Clp protease ATP-binding subunit ClpC